jgi:hypothetical protein
MNLGRRYRKQDRRDQSGPDIEQVSTDEEHDCDRRDRKQDRQ